MLLDELVTAIQTVQARIREHGDSLRENEYRTRISLIDPILNALGWDVSNPALVTPEYQVGNGRADYALLGGKGNPRAFLEAKRLGEMLEASKHETQLFTYAVTQGVRYAGLTDGDRWIFDNLTARFSGGESRLLDVRISKESAHQCVLKFLLLWRPNLGLGQLIEASEPILVAHPQTEPSIETSEPTVDPKQPLSPVPGWTPLTEYNAIKGGRPPTMRVPGKGELEVRYWYDIVIETAEWVIRTGDLTASKCPVKKGTLNIHTVDDTPRRSYMHTSELSNGLFLNIKKSIKDVLASAAFLIQHFGKDPSSILLKSS